MSKAHQKQISKHDYAHNQLTFFTLQLLLFWQFPKLNTPKIQYFKNLNDVHVIGKQYMV